MQRSTEVSAAVREVFSGGVGLGLRSAAISPSEFIHHVNQGVKAAVAVDVRFGEFPETPVSLFGIMVHSFNKANFRLGKTAHQIGQPADLLVMLRDLLIVLFGRCGEFLDQLRNHVRSRRKSHLMLKDELHRLFEIHDTESIARSIIKRWCFTTNSRWKWSLH